MAAVSLIDELLMNERRKAGNNQLGAYGESPMSGILDSILQQLPPMDSVSAQLAQAGSGNTARPLLSATSSIKEFQAVLRTEPFQRYIDACRSLMRQFELSACPDDKKSEMIKNKANDALSSGNAVLANSLYTEAAYFASSRRVLSVCLANRARGYLDEIAAASKVRGDTSDRARIERMSSELLRATCALRDAHAAATADPTYVKALYRRACGLRVASKHLDAVLLKAPTVTDSTGKSLVPTVESVLAAAAADEAAALSADGSTTTLTPEQLADIIASPIVAATIALLSGTVGLRSPLEQATIQIDEDGSASGAPGSAETVSSATTEKVFSGGAVAEASIMFDKCIPPTAIHLPKPVISACISVAEAKPPSADGAAQHKCTVNSVVPAGTALIAEWPVATALAASSMFVVCSGCLRSGVPLYPPAVHLSNGPQKPKYTLRGLFCSPVCETILFGPREGTNWEAQNVVWAVCSPTVLLAQRTIMRNRAVAERIAAAHRQDQASLLSAGTEGRNLAYSPFGIRASVEAALLGILCDFPDSDVELLRGVAGGLPAHSFHIQTGLSTGIGVPALKSYGTAVYRCLSVLNHGCIPNAHVQCAGAPSMTSGLLILRASRGLLKGEEVTVAYGPTVRAIRDTYTRRDAIAKALDFACKCAACKVFPKDAFSAEQQRALIKAADLFQKSRRVAREGNDGSNQPSKESAVQSYELLLSSLRLLRTDVFTDTTAANPVLAKTQRALADAALSLSPPGYAAALDHIIETKRILAVLYGEGCADVVDECVRAASIAIRAKDKRAPVLARDAEKMLQLWYGEHPVVEPFRAVASSEPIPGLAPVSDAARAAV